MSRAWNPGDVAMVTMTCGDKSTIYPRCIWDACNEQWVDGKMGALYPSERVWKITEIRPLVVINPEDRAQVERFLTDYLTRYDGMKSRPQRQEVDCMQEALRSLVTPPKPDEPTGLGAVVEDAEGDRWVRCRRAGHRGLLGVEWENERTTAHAHWHTIAAVKVLSEGVTP